MYRVYITDAKTKDIYREQYINMVNYQEDDINKIFPFVKYFCQKGLTVIVEEEKDD